MWYRDGRLVSKNNVPEAAQRMAQNFDPKKEIFIDKMEINKKEIEQYT